MLQSWFKIKSGDGKPVKVYGCMTLNRSHTTPTLTDPIEGARSQAINVN